MHVELREGHFDASLFQRVEDPVEPEPEPMTSVWRTSVKYIQISDTQITPYISMKQLERTPVRSTSAPNMIGRMNPPIPPARPTMPDTTPMLCGYSSEMYLNTDALPNAHATPMVNISAVNT